MEKKVLMKKIVDRIGRDKAIEIVTLAYNTELLTSNLRRLEDNDRKIGGYQRRDHLMDALERVSEVCELAG